MSNQNILDQLSASDDDQVLLTLSRLGSEQNERLSPAVLEKMMELITHRDPDI